MNFQLYLQLILVLCYTINASNISPKERAPMLSWISHSAAFSCHHTLSLDSLTKISSLCYYIYNNPINCGIPYMQVQLLLNYQKFIRRNIDVFHHMTVGAGRDLHGCGVPSTITTCSLFLQSFQLREVSFPSLIFPFFLCYALISS